ncbi:MAG TPA: GAF domain-containing sensor histidine kinase [Nitriliruptorales bacterium]|nr:GAF domain-containing sensor histidine kinase [Nitriliruptorales bacterium]
MATHQGLGLDDPDRERALLQRIIDTVTAGLDLDEVVQGVAAIIIDATATDVCFVHLVDHERQRLVLSGATPPFDRLAGSIELELGEGIAGWVASHQEPVVIVDDKLSDPRYRYIPALRGEEYTSLASVPMVSAPGRLVGVLNVHTHERRDFTASDVKLLGAIANLVAGAVENARLHRQLTLREVARERFAERLVHVQENERRRLAAEIHDGISQRIVGLSFHLSAAADALDSDTRFTAEQIAAAQRLAAEALDETRRAIAGLRPSVLDDLGLAAGLESLVRSLPFAAAELEIEPCQLPEHVETALYRIAQEALQNAAKHASANEVRVALAVRRDVAVLEIADDGHGFDPAAAPAAERVTYGLAGMRERADLLGARLEVDSAPGAGTTIRVVAPMSPGDGRSRR